MQLLQNVLDSLTKSEYRLLTTSRTSAGYRPSTETSIFLKRLGYHGYIPSDPNGQRRFFHGIKKGSKYSTSKWELQRKLMLVNTIVHMKEKKEQRFFGKSFLILEIYGFKVLNFLQ